MTRTGREGQAGREEEEVLWGELCFWYQRGKKHLAMIEEGKIYPPIVLHFWEDHGGGKQDVLMTPLDRPIKESANIIEAMIRTLECLHRKSEWGGQNTRPSGRGTQRTCV